MPECRVCYEPCTTHLGCVCRGYAHVECIMQACKARYEITHNETHLTECDVCHTCIVNFYLQLARQAYEITGSDASRLLLAILTNSDPVDKVDFDPTSTHPITVFIRQFYDIRNTDPSGDATEAYVRLHKDSLSLGVYMKYLMEAAMIYFNNSNDERANIICHEVYAMLGESPDTRNFSVLSTISFVAVVACYVDAPFLLSLSRVREDMVGVLGEHHDHTINFDMSLCIAHIYNKEYETVIPKLISVIKIMREIKPKHCKETLMMTRWLARTYCCLGKMDKAQPLVRYLVKHKFKLTPYDNIIFGLSLL